MYILYVYTYTYRYVYLFENKKRNPDSFGLKCFHFFNHIPLHILHAARPMWHSTGTDPTLLRGLGAVSQRRGLQHGPTQSERTTKTAPHGCKATCYLPENYYCKIILIEKCCLGDVQDRFEFIFD